MEEMTYKDKQCQLVVIIPFLFWGIYSVNNDAGRVFSR